jgi:hypothetical protein
MVPDDSMTNGRRSCRTPTDPFPTEVAVPMFKFSKRRVIVLGALLTLALSGAALAFWTAGGSGSGTASVGNATGLTANQTSTLTAMYPGDSAQTLSGDFDNPNSGKTYVGTVTASISSVTDGSGAVAVGCDASDFTLASKVMTVNAEVPNGTNVGAWSGATIKFNDKATNQDACKGVTVHLAYAIA